MLGAEFWFLPNGLRKQGRKAAQAGEQPTYLNFNICSTRDPLQNEGLVTFCYKQCFDWTHPEGTRGNPGPRRVKIKSQLGYFYRWFPFSNEILRAFLFYSTVWLHAPQRHYRPIKILKRCLFSSLLNKSWEFGGLALTNPECDPKTYGFVQLFDLTQPGGTAGLSKSHKSI